MSIDYEFIKQMLMKHIKHLENETKYLDNNLSGYDRQISSLSKLDERKYGFRLTELDKKRSEAYVKLEYISENIRRMYGQIEEINSLDK